MIAEEDLIRDKHDNGCYDEYLFDVKSAFKLTSQCDSA